MFLTGHNERPKQRKKNAALRHYGFDLSPKGSISALFSGAAHWFAHLKSEVT